MRDWDEREQEKKDWKHDYYGGSLPCGSWADDPESDIGFPMAGTELEELRLMNFTDLTQRGG